MKDYLKNANLYYAAVPVLVALWAFFTWTVSLPRADEEWAKLRKEYDNVQVQVAKILTIDPERLDYTTKEGKAIEFDYVSVIDKVAKEWGIPESAYNLQAKKAKKIRGQEAQSANISIKPVKIETITQFLSALLLRWPDLQCDLIKLTKLNDGPDSWKADMKLTYYQ